MKTEKNLVSEIAANKKAEIDLVSEVKYGLPVSEVAVLRETFAMTDADLAPKLGMSIPTLYRRRQKNERLDPEASDKVVRLARLFGLAREFFEGDEEAARRWFLRPAAALGGEKPIEMAGTEI